MVALSLGLSLAIVFGLLNGFHDAANAVAALVATRAARPASAVVLAAVFHILGPFLAGTAVAATVGGIVTVKPTETVAVVGAALVGAIAWNVVTWWWGLPTSSSHSLVGGLVGAALAAAGTHAVNWGGMDGLRPVGVIGVLVWLALSPVIGVAAGFVGIRMCRAALRRARRNVEVPIRRSEWVTASALAFSHGSNDAQKTMGVMTLLLVSTNHLSRFAVPGWVTLVSALALTIGTSLGGWRVVRTLGSGIYRIRALEGLVSQGSSAGIVLAAALAGAPISTTDVVAPTIVGVGAGRRWRRVRWRVAGNIAISWIVTLPVCAVLAALVLPLWRSAGG